MMKTFPSFQEIGTAAVDFLENRLSHGEFVHWMFLRGYCDVRESAVPRSGDRHAVRLWDDLCFLLSQFSAARGGMELADLRSDVAMCVNRAERRYQASQERDPRQAPEPS